MRKIFVVLSALLAVFLWGGSAQASNVHLKGGANAEPTFTAAGYS
jgi:hypothetical protein